MTAKWSNEDWKKFLLDHWGEWFRKAQITYRAGAPEAPSDKKDLLDFLNEWAARICWPGSDAPIVEREQDGFVLRRRLGKQDTYRKNIYTALGTVLQEHLLKPENC